MPKFSWVLSNFPLQYAAPNQGKALVTLLLVLSLTIVACSRIPNPFTPIDSGDRILAAQRDSAPPKPRPSTATEPTSTLLSGTTPGVYVGVSATATAITTAAPVATEAASATTSPIPTATSIAVEKGIFVFGTPSPTKTPTEQNGKGPVIIDDLSDVFASATPTITPTATLVPPTPEVPPTARPVPVATATAGLPQGSATATAVSTETPRPTRTPEPTEKPNYGGEGSPGGTLGGEGTTPGTATPTPFGISSATPTVTSGPTETPTPDMPPTPTRTPFPTATSIPEGTYDAIVNVLMMPNDFQIETGEEFALDVVIDPNGQEITVAQAVLSFDPDYLEAISSIHNPESPLPNQITANDNIDNDAGIVILSSAPHNTSGLPSTSFRLGTVTFKAKNEGGQTDIIFIRSGNVITRAGLSGFNLIDNYDLSIVSISIPPTPTPTPTP